MIDPRTSLILNIALALLGVVAAAGSYFTDMFGAATSKEIVETAGFTVAIFGAVNSSLHAYSSPKAGPFVSTGS